MTVDAVVARIERVTVYASGARVRRVTELAAASPRVRIDGLPISVIDNTVRVEVAGPAIATSVRTGVDAPAADDAAPEVGPALRAARRRADLAAAELERVRAALEHNDKAPIVVANPTREPPAPWVDVVAARRDIIALRTSRELELRGQLVAAQRALEEARRAAEAEADRDARAGTARAAKLHELRKYVEIELVASAPGPIVVHLEYLVGAARWAPSYVARLDAERTSLEIRAVVAQDTGEDWSGVPLALSTAEPARFAQLPELAAQRIGRRQQEASRAGFRAPPAGAEALYVDYDRDRARLFPAPPPKQPAKHRAPEPPRQAARDDTGGFKREVWDEESSRAKEAYDTPALGTVLAAVAPQAAAPPSAPPPSAPPVAKTMMSPVRSRGAPSAGHGRASAALGGGGAPPAPGSPPVLEQALRMPEGAPAYQAPPPGPAPTARLDYGELRMAPAGSSSRGKLIPAPRDRRANNAEQEAAAKQRLLDLVSLPPGCVAGWVHTYDYAFETDGAVEVRSDGAWHSIPVTARTAQATLHHISVPREQADVFRQAQIANPFDGPLLPGPIDVYDRGRFLLTSSVDYAPPGAPIEIGLGVDPAVKIARNTEFREEVGGMLRGALKLIHGISIELENLSGRPVEVEVRERVPVAREGDDEVEITVARPEPAWERWTPDPEAPRDQRLRGGYRWRVAIPPAQKRTLRAGYEVKISGKLELAGGNRRES